MAPNAIISTPSKSKPQNEISAVDQRWYHSLPSAVGVLIGLFAATKASWTRLWFVSAGLQSLLLIHSFSLRRLSGPQLFLSLLALNGAYVICSSSWILQSAFILLCTANLALTGLLHLPLVSRISRGCMRGLFRDLYFFHDKVAFFNIPALVIDTEVYGLFVVRGIAISLARAEIEVHGVELGLMLSDEVELSLCLDFATIRLFRSITISDVYGNIKVESSEGTFGDAGNVKYDHKRIFEAAAASIQSNSPILLNLQSTDSQSNIRQSHGSNDHEAETKYNEGLELIRESSQINVARKELEKAPSTSFLNTESKVRQAICAKLKRVPSISHRSTSAVSVRVLQTIFPRLRRFLHRFPLFIRLVLNPLSYLHPIDISSINIAGPGDQLEKLLHEHAFSGNGEDGSGSSELDEELSVWLGEANFCIEIGSLDAVTHVPLTASSNIIAYLRSRDINLYRTKLEAEEVKLVTRIGGADGTVVIPACLLPHHEHCLPSPPSKASQIMESASNSKDSTYKTTNGETNNEQDAAEMVISVHASLPTFFDQSLLDMAASLLKATGLLDLENFFTQEGSNKRSLDERKDSHTDENVDEENEEYIEDEPNAAVDGSDRADAEPSADANISKSAGRAKRLAKSGLRKIAKNNALGDKINDRWVAKTVGKLATRLENAKGDFGYTTPIQIPLQPYRPTTKVDSKILP